MSYFPTFLKFDDKKILIIGGGKIANDKLTHLLDFTNKITIITPTISSDMQDTINKNSLMVINRAYKKGDIKDFDIIVAAINDMPLQQEIFEESRKSRCLYNCVDIKECCDFIFPSYVRKGDLTLAISTNGGSPALTKQLRIYFQEAIPDSIKDFLDEMKNYRTTMPKGKDRMKFLESKAKEYLKTWSNK
jgi:precorrin-2 dehydrogenase/sirohydrochlorin ferrochelatase